MKRYGPTGGIINSCSILNPNDYSRSSVNRIALSSSIREAARIGLQTLYADPHKALEKYKDQDFDIANEMEKRRNMNLLWVRARAIDADVPNRNGDYFSEEELLKEVEHDNKKMPAYKTFEGVPIYTNHDNKDIEKAKGAVVFAEWDDEEKCVWVVFYVDEDAYPELARGIRAGYMQDVSMGCSVEEGICSICGNKATTEDDYCVHMLEHKGRTDPSTGKLAYEKNLNIKFFELSVVNDGAFTKCMVDEIYDIDEIQTASGRLVAASAKIQNNIALASVQAAKSPSKEQKIVENFLRDAYKTNASILKAANHLENKKLIVAQEAGTLVGGPAMMGQQGNATVSNIMQMLGVDPSSGLNVLDVLNLGLNFLEVAIINMLSKSNSIKLEYVSKISKVMAEIQSVMEEVINDGVDAAPQPPGVQLQGGPAQAPQGQPNQPTAPMSFDNPVGQIFSPYAQTNEEAEDLLTANAHKILQKVSNAVVKLAAIVNNNENLATAWPIKNEEAETKPGVKMSNNIFEKVAMAHQKEAMAKMKLDVSFSDRNKEYKVVLSTDHGLKGFIKDKPVDWNYCLSENQLNAFVSGDQQQISKVGNDLLNEFIKQASTHTVTASTHEGDKETMENQLEAERTEAPTDVQEEQLETERTGHEDKVQEEKLEATRLGTDEDTVQEDKLESADAGLFARKGFTDKVTEELLEEARANNELDCTIEECLEQFRTATTNVEYKEVVSNVLTKLAEAAIDAKCTPAEMLQTIESMVAEDYVEDRLSLASLGAKVRATRLARQEFYQQERVASCDLSSDIMRKSAYDHLGSLVHANAATVSQIKEALEDVTDNELTAEVIDTVTAIAKEKLSTAKAGVLKTEAQASRKDVLKSILASNKESKEELSALQLRDVLAACVQTVLAHQITPAEFVDELSEDNLEKLSEVLEAARSVEASKQRKIAIQRLAFYGDKLSSQMSSFDYFVGTLADKINEAKMPTRLAVKATQKIASNPEYATQYISKLALSYLQKQAMQQESAESDNDSGTVIYATAQDFDIKEATEQNALDKVVEALSAENYTIDEAVAKEAKVTVDGDLIKIAFNADLAKNDDVESELFESNDGVLITASAKKVRSMHRSASLKKIAQMMGGQPNMGAAPGVGVDPGMGMGDAAAAGMDMNTEMPGVGAFTQENDPGMMDDGMGMDAASTPGKQLPLGAICYACGSQDTDVVGDNMKCKTCGASATIQYSLVPNPDSYKPGAETRADDIVDDESVDVAAEEMAMPMNNAMPAGMPGMMQQPQLMQGRISWDIDSKSFLRTASKTPVGAICPHCGSKDTTRVANNCYCDNCNRQYKFRIAKSDKPGKVKAELTCLLAANS